MLDIWQNVVNVLMVYFMGQCVTQPKIIVAKGIKKVLSYFFRRHNKNGERAAAVAAAAAQPQDAIGEQQSEDLQETFYDGEEALLSNDT